LAAAFWLLLLQMEAVTGGLDGSPVVLIQGPPGTGKTKTILGLLSIIMHSAPRGAFAAATVPAVDEALSPRAAAAARLPSYMAYRQLSAEARREAWLEANPVFMGRPDPRWADGLPATCYSLPAAMLLFLTACWQSFQLGMAGKASTSRGIRCRLPRLCLCRAGRRLCRMTGPTRQMPLACCSAASRGG
jgi:hypothetical protein